MEPPFSRRCCARDAQRHRGARDPSHAEPLDGRCRALARHLRARPGLADSRRRQSGDRRRDGGRSHRAWRRHPHGAPGHRACRGAHPPNRPLRHDPDRDEAHRRAARPLRAGVSLRQRGSKGRLRAVGAGSLVERRPGARWHAAPWGNARRDRGGRARGGRGPASSQSLRAGLAALRLRPDARAGRQARALGLHARASGIDTGPHRGRDRTDRALRSRLP